MTINLNEKIVKKKAEIRGVEILKNIPLHLETIQLPIVNPRGGSSALEA